MGNITTSSRESSSKRLKIKKLAQRMKRVIEDRAGMSREYCEFIRSAMIVHGKSGLVEVFP